MAHRPRPARLAAHNHRRCLDLHPPPAIHLELRDRDEPIEPDQRGDVATFDLHQGPPVAVTFDSHINSEVPDRARGPTKRPSPRSPPTLHRVEPRNLTRTCALREVPPTPPTGEGLRPQRGAACRRTVNGERLFLKGSNLAPTRAALAEPAGGRAGRCRPGRRSRARPVAGARPHRAAELYDAADES